MQYCGTYDRFRVTFDRNSDHGLMRLISRAIAKHAKNRKGYVAPSVVQRDA